MASSDPDPYDRLHSPDCPHHPDYPKQRPVEPTPTTDHDDDSTDTPTIHHSGS